MTFSTLPCVSIIPWIGIQYYRFRFSLADGRTGSGQWRGFVLSKQVLQAATHPGRTERIECFIEDQAFSLSYDLALPPSPISKLSLVVSHWSSLLTGEGGRSQIIRRWESLVLYKSCNTLRSKKYLKAKNEIKLQKLTSYNAADFCVKC